MHATLFCQQCLVFLALLYLSEFSWAANEDSDLQLIPETVIAQPTPDSQITSETTEKSYHIKKVLERNFHLNAKRGTLLVPLPESQFVRWDNRITFDLQGEVKLTPGLKATFTNSFNHLMDSDTMIGGSVFLNDVRETYLSWNFYKSHYIDLGRENLKNGVALGFNPTDYFKKNALSARISDDPAVLRENRLGTLLTKVQGIWESGALTLVVAPKIGSKPGPWWNDDNDSGFGLNLGLTNSRNRFLVKANTNFFVDLNPELLYYREQGRNPHYGLNLTAGLSDKMVTYIEWSGSKKTNIINQAIQENKLGCSLLGNSATRFRQQLAIGFSYTEKNVNRTTYFEYHYNQAGFYRQDWQNWFNTGENAQKLLNNPSTIKQGRNQLGQLWSIRDWALTQAQEPLNRHTLFVRNAWEKAFIEKLNITTLLQVNLYDGSTFVSPLAEYHLYKYFLIDGGINWFSGTKKSEYGSLENAFSLKIGIKYYF